MNPFPPDEPFLPYDDLSQFDRADRICDAYERAWLEGLSPQIPDYLSQAPEVDRAKLERELEAIKQDYESRLQQAGDRSGSSHPLPLESSTKNRRELTLAPRIPRFRIINLLGQGGFGRVYLAQDEQLDRPVAIKVPHAVVISRLENVEAYLAEARMVANLDHAGIVPVYDVGSAENCPCYIVSKYIEGTNLSTFLQTSRPHDKEAVELIATVADSLHYAHEQGIVHRDVKPGNILVSTKGIPYLVDFGLALQEKQFGTGPKSSGTPAYMSPEQARGEGHRVDCRSDVFSLGVVFYELLTGCRPFTGGNPAELLQQVTNCEVQPLRQLDKNLPKELERICLKAMAKRALDRYTSARELAEDLRQYLAEQTLVPSETFSVGIVSPQSITKSPLSSSTSKGFAQAAGASKNSSPDFQPVKVLPKGLRSFDEHDADFFLELLPGPHDRHGLPDSLRFWKLRIEETDPERTFSVGLIYGPSGCGKSSLVKAGLLPRLSPNLIPIYVEATPDKTETQLLIALRKLCPTLDDTRSLAQTLVALRRGQGFPAGKKVLLVLDQFEQWLHGRKEEEATELVHSLRQCDGGRVQCLLMVRDDFWMATTRFLQELEIPLLEGQNSAAMDLFSIRHSEKVLAAFGRAFGAIPENQDEQSKDQTKFLRQSVSCLAQGGKITCVRLALFAEMIKGKPWTPSTLKEFGGTVGVGAAFLEETFSAENAPPKHRYHQKAARAVLGALLPEPGTEIKGHLKSIDELLEVSGYTQRRKEFEGLVQILDSEVRLITPTDSKGLASSDDVEVSNRAEQKYYQLTHDYLVPELRDWLSRKQRETRRGRAELCLAERAAYYQAQPEPRNLPSAWEFLMIRFLTTPNNWTAPQQNMLRSASRYYTRRCALLAVVGMMLIAVGLWMNSIVTERQNALQAVRLTEGLFAADIFQVPELINKLSNYRAWADPVLAENVNSDQSRIRLRASLALLPVDPTQTEFLADYLLVADPDEVAILCQLLAPQKEHLTTSLWQVLKSTEPDLATKRLRAACGLAVFDPDNPAWPKVAPDVAALLTAVNPTFSRIWMQNLFPVRDRLFEPLFEIFADADRPETERSLATDFLAHYASGNPSQLAELCLAAGPKQFDALFPILEKHGVHGIEFLRAELTKIVDPKFQGARIELEKELLSRRQANAVAALTRLGEAEHVWPRLQFQTDPRLRSWIIHRLAILDVDPQLLFDRLIIEQDVSVRRALLLALGEYDVQTLPNGLRERLAPKLVNWYRDDPDAGMHATVFWLAHRWNDLPTSTSNPEQVDAQPHVRRGGLLSQLRKVDVELATGNIEGDRRWYVSRHGQTLMVIDQPQEPFLMGSPATEANRAANEMLHETSLPHRFAIADREVTVEQYLKHFPDFDHHEMRRSPDPDCPVQGLTWYDSALYCNMVSRAEGIPEDQWCYLPVDQGTSASGMRLAPDYLSRTGYRLPTEAEWEYACRAGTNTSRYYGQCDELLEKYCWYLENAQERTWPAGLKKPNDWGLFDMLGNVYDWCNDDFAPYNTGINTNRENAVKPKEIELRVLRGGPYNFKSQDLRAAFRNNARPIDRFYLLGIRLARTCR